MKILLPFLLFSTILQNQPSKLQMIEEALERVLMTHSINYERSKNVESRLSDVTYTYTGNTVIDAKQDSLLYVVYGTYTYSKYSYVQAPNPINGGTTGKSFNNTGSRTYIAKVKSVLDDYRVQEILVVEEPDKFDFGTCIFDSLKAHQDWIYPTAVIQSSSKKSK